MTQEAHAKAPELNIFQRYPQAWWAGGAAVVLAIILWGLSAGWIYAIDWPVTYAFVAFRGWVLSLGLPEDITSLASDFSGLIYPAVLLPVAIVMCALFKNKNLFWVLLIDVVCVKVLNMFLKYLVNRPRPFIQDPSVWYQNQAETSFPSGHAMMAVGFFGLIVVILWTYTRGKDLRVFWCVFLTIVILLVLLARIYLSVHFFSDVLAGSCFSILWLCFYTKWIMPLFLGVPPAKTQA